MTSLRRVSHIVAVLGALSTTALAADVSLEDVCSSKPARKKNEAVGDYAKRVMALSAQLAGPLSTKPADDMLPGLLRAVAGTNGLKTCALADRWELEGLLGQSPELPSAGLEVIISTSAGRADNVKTGLAVKEVLKSAGVVGHLHFGTCSHTATERGCLRLRLPKAEAFDALQAALAKQGLLAAYPVVVKGGVLGAPLEAARLRAVCDALKNAKGTSAQRFAEVGRKVDLSKASIELRAFLSAGANVPDMVFDDFAEQGVRDFNYSERCLTR